MLPLASVSQTYLESIITRHLFVSKSIKGNLCKEIASRLQFSGSYGSVLCCWLALTVESPHEVTNK